MPRGSAANCAKKAPLLVTESKNQRTYTTRRLSMSKLSIWFPFQLLDIELVQTKVDVETAIDSGAHQNFQLYAVIVRYISQGLSVSTFFNWNYLLNKLPEHHLDWFLMLSEHFPDVPDLGPCVSREPWWNCFGQSLLRDWRKLINPLLWCT